MVNRMKIFSNLLNKEDLIKDELCTFVSDLIKDANLEEQLRFECLEDEDYYGYLVLVFEFSNGSDIQLGLYDPNTYGSDDEELNDVGGMKEYLKDELEDIIENL